MKNHIVRYLFLLFMICSLKINAQSYANLGKLTKETTESTYNEAEEAFAKSVKKNKKDAFVYFERHFFYMKFHKYELALNDINKAVELLPGKYLFYEYRIDLYFIMDSMDMAAKDIDVIYRMDATIPDAHIYKGQYFFKKDSLELSFQCYNKAITIYENNNAKCLLMSRCYGGRGALNLAFGNIDAAIYDFSKSIVRAKETRKDNLFLLRARAFLLKKDTQNAFQDIGSAIATKPDSMTLGYIYAIKGDAENVELIKNTVLSKKTVLNYRNGVNMYNIACFYSILNNKEKALEYLEKSLQLGYDKFNWIQVDYDMRNIKGLPQFTQLIQKYQTNKQK